MNKRKNNKLLYFILSIILILSVFYSGFYFGKNKKTEIEKVEALINKDGEISEKIDFSPFWKAWNVINEKYVSLDDVDTQDKVWGAIQGLSASLGDPYTMFMPPEDAEIFSENISGNFSGVGMEIGLRDNTLTVIAPLKDTPAEKAGVKSGDKIIKIDDKLTSNFNADKAVKLIRGKIGTPVKLTISREGVSELIDINIIRDNIDIPTIKTELRGDVFIINLYSFSANSPNLFKKALQKFSKTTSTKLVLDLRGNPGGYLEAAVDIASWFLPKGKIIVSENFGEGKEERVHRSSGYNVFSDDLKLVILVNLGSASASEILAGALQEHNIATIVGTKTFGKGSVQELVEITPDTSLKVTIARWLTPNGVSISKNGLTPDIEVDLTLEDFKEGRDPQLEKAIEILENIE